MEQLGIGRKKCSKCRKEKPSTREFFYKDRSKKDGLKTICIGCDRENHKRYINENKEKVAECSRKYREKNREKIRERRKKYREENRENLRAYDRKRYWENREKSVERVKEYYRKNLEDRRKYGAKYRNMNRDEINQRSRSRRKKKHKEIRVIERRYEERIRKERSWILAWKGAIRNVIQRMKKNQRTEEIISSLGYSVEEFKSCLESQFADGMCWENYGMWHVDHKRPVSSFDKNTPVSEVNALSNLQPMWAMDNISKGNKIIDG